MIEVRQQGRHWASPVTSPTSGITPLTSRSSAHPDYKTKLISSNRNCILPLHPTAIPFSVHAPRRLERQTLFPFVRLSV